MNRFLLLAVMSIFFSIAATAELRDPTQPVNISSLSTDPNGGLALSAIISSDHQQIAVINGVIVKAGDQVFGNKVVAIDANSVRLEGVNGRITLFLLKQSVKKQVQ